MSYYSFPSDHWAVLFNVLGISLGHQTKYTQIRKWKSIDCTEFGGDILRSQLADATATTFGCADVVKLYDSVMRELVDKHAPSRKQARRVRCNAPWYNHDVNKAKYLEET